MRATGDVAERIGRIEQGVILEPQLRSLPDDARPLAERMALLGVPGVSIAVNHNGALAWAHGYGVREAGGTAPITEHALFQACSNSKPTTAVAVMRLAQEGTLDLDEDVNAHLTSWKVPDNGSWQPRVTLRHLLSHTAGTTVHGFPGYRRDGPVPTLRQVLEGEAPANTPAIRMNAIPGTHFRYSSGGTSIVQQLLIDVTGLPFPQLMRDLVLEPLGMADSTYEQPLPERRWADAATGHRTDGGPVMGQLHVYPEMAAAGLWTTPADLAWLLVEVQRVRTGGAGRLLTHASVDTMLTLQFGGPVGIGFFVASAGAALRFGHGDDNEGFKCLATTFAEQGTGAVVMTNGDMGWQICKEIEAAIARMYGWPLASDEERPGLLYPARQAAEVDPHVYTAYAGEYELRPEYRLQVAVEGDALTLHPAGQPALRLWPTSETAYFAEEADVEVTFLRDAAGTRTGLTFRQNAADLLARRPAVETPEG
jgi:CubicO group peptidase (beta-lactamase class C family)